MPPRTQVLRILAASHWAEDGVRSNKEGSVDHHPNTDSVDSGSYYDDNDNKENNNKKNKNKDKKTTEAQGEETTEDCKNDAINSQSRVLGPLVAASF